jgi:DNA-binding transcriptional MerR regulator
MRLTGLSADRLRVWERRHQAVQPSRTGTGRRAYGEAEVKRLRLLADLVRQGHSIGQLASQSDRDLSLLLAQGGSNSGSGLAREDFDGLLNAIDAFDMEALRRGIARYRHLLSPQDFSFTLVPQLMAQVGMKIEEGKFTVAQEHGVSDLLRHVLRQQYDDLAPLEGTVKGVALLAAPEGHLHDFGILLSAILCRFHGFSTHFLGPNLPAASIVSAAKGLGASAVILGISRLGPDNTKVEINEFLAELDRALPRKVSLWLGGPGSGEVKRKKIQRTAWVFESLEELRQKLESLRGQL